MLPSAQQQQQQRGGGGMTTYWNPVRMMSGSFNMDGTDSSINE
jgi:hypothetical protein